MVAFLFPFTVKAILDAAFPDDAWLHALVIGIVFAVSAALLSGLTICVVTRERAHTRKHGCRSGSASGVPTGTGPETGTAVSLLKTPFNYNPWTVLQSGADPGASVAAAFNLGNFMRTHNDGVTKRRTQPKARSVYFATGNREEPEMNV